MTEVFVEKPRLHRVSLLTLAMSGVICVDLLLIYVESMVMCVRCPVIRNVFCYIFNDKYVVVNSP